MISLLLPVLTSLAFAAGAEAGWPRKDAGYLPIRIGLLVLVVLLAGRTWAQSDWLRLALAATPFVAIGLRHLRSRGRLDWVRIGLSIPGWIFLPILILLAWLFDPEIDYVQTIPSPRDPWVVETTFGGDWDDYGTTVRLKPQGFVSWNPFHYPAIIVTGGGRYGLFSTRWKGDGTLIIDVEPNSEELPEISSGLPVRVEVIDRRTNKSE